MRHLILAALLVLSPAPLAAQTGTASGIYQEDGVKIPLGHAVALRKDDSEGILFDQAGIWVLLSNVEVDPMVLAGDLFPPAYDLAKQGKLEGLLFVVKPGNKTDLSISVFATQDRNQGSFRTLSLSSTPSLWDRLTVGPNRISGTLVSGDTKFSFDVPIAENPITEDLHGAAARSSPQYAALMANAKAWLAGDFTALKATVTRRRQAEIDGYPAAVRPQLVAQARPDMQALLRAAPTLDRVVVRGATASIKTADGSAYSFAREDGTWKVD